MLSSASFSARASASEGRAENHGRIAAVEDPGSLGFAGAVHSSKPMHDVPDEQRWFQDEFPFTSQDVCHTLHGFVARRTSLTRTCSPQALRTRGRRAWPLEQQERFARNRNSPCASTRGCVGLSPVEVKRGILWAGARPRNGAPFSNERACR